MDLWIENHKGFKFFLDGEAKGNLGILGLGDLIMDPLGRTIMSFSWGLGEGTNNYIDLCAL